MSQNPQTPKDKKSEDKKIEQVLRRLDRESHYCYWRTTDKINYHLVGFSEVFTPPSDSNAYSVYSLEEDEMHIKDLGIITDL